MTADSELSPRNASQLVFPPDLVLDLRQLESVHDFTIPLPDAQMAELLTQAFFASVRREEREHHSLRIAVLDGVRPPPARTPGVEARPRAREPRVDSRTTAHEQTAEAWRLFGFARPISCSARHLLRLARAAPSERLFVAVCAEQSRLVIKGLARETGHSSAATLKLVAPEPGCLEVWLGQQRLLEYAHGRVVSPPENVLLSAGLVRSVLLEHATASPSPHEYVESVRSLVREVAAHGYGGILVISADEPNLLRTDVGLVLEAELSINLLQEALTSVGKDPDSPHRQLLLESLRAELALTLAEVGRLTALDGATILDKRLSVRAFGAILPVSINVSVQEARDAAAASLVPFLWLNTGLAIAPQLPTPINIRAALVFIASSDGDMACLLRVLPAPDVLMWRFRSGDLTSSSD